MINKLLIGKTGRAFFLLAGVGIAALASTDALAWSLEEAAAPYKGVTIRTVGEALPPLEAMDKLKSQFEERTGIKVVIEMY